MSNFKSYGDVAKKAWEKHLECHPMDKSYACTLSMHAIARYAVENQDQAILDRVKSELKPFIEDKIANVGGAYGPTVYRVGGNASAYLLYKGVMPEAREILCRHVELLMTEQSRDLQGIFDMRHGGASHSRGFIWIDTVFGVCPFLVYMGRVTGDKRYYDEAVKQMMGHHTRLRDPELRIYHQAVNVRDSLRGWSAIWSRGQGWGIHGLIDMIMDMPKDHPGYQTIVEAFLDTMAGSLSWQDEKGMFHQVVNQLLSYPETSGTGMIMYGLGRSIECGVISAKNGVEPFLRGIKGLLEYIEDDGSVNNCCPGCLAPGNGTEADYSNRWWNRNDEHSFGPYIMAFAAAEALHRKGIIPSLPEILA